jgi:hypothetical protein
MTEYLNYYCSNSTFLSILKNSELWLTALSLSNDRMEGVWALEQYLNLFRGERANKRRAAQMVIEPFLHGREALVVCFSEKEDLLSQWRGYADDGAGMCISFSKEKLEKVVQECKPNGDIRLVKVKYGRLAEHDFVKPIADTFMEDVERVKTDGQFMSARLWTH